MDAGFNIYEMDEEQTRALKDGVTEKIDAAQLAKLEADVARMHGYLKGRAESDRSAHEKLVWDSANGPYVKADQ